MLVNRYPLNRLIAHGSERKDSHLAPPNRHSHHCRLAVHKPCADPFSWYQISLIVSKVNETALPSYIRGFTVKLTTLHIQDNYDGSTLAWAPSGNFPDAAQATTLFNLDFSEPSAQVHSKLPALRDSLHRLTHRSLYNPVVQHHAECRLNNFPIAKGLSNPARGSSPTVEFWQ